jgi:hypothetical protein
MRQILDLVDGTPPPTDLGRQHSRHRQWWPCSCHQRTEGRRVYHGGGPTDSGGVVAAVQGGAALWPRPEARAASWRHVTQSSMAWTSGGIAVGWIRPLGPDIGPSTCHGQIAGVDGPAGVLKKGGVFMALVAPRRWSSWCLPSMIWPLTSSRRLPPDISIERLMHVDC